MGFLNKNPERIRATREFCAAVSRVTDPLALVLFEIENLDERVAWTVAAEVLRQSITLPMLGSLIQELRRQLPGSLLWCLPAPRQKIISDVLKKQPWLKGWILEPHLLGILASVGVWVRNTGNQPYLYVSKSNMTELWREFSKIYFIGKSNQVRPKVLSLLFRLTAPVPMGLDLPVHRDPLASGNLWPYPVYAGARKWLKLIGPDPRIWMERHTELERLQYFQKMYQGIYPAHPEVVAYGLSIFLEQQGTELLCINSFGGCVHCPLAAMSPVAGSCPGRKI